MDCIEQLPSSEGFTSILVMVNRLSKQALFILTYDTITSTELVKLFPLYVFSKHRVPTHVMSNRGSKLISHFFQFLGKALDMCLHFTSGYNSKGNGQTKHANQTLKQYLWIYCNYQQDNWSELLPLAEFSYNNVPSTTTGVSPFFANKGYYPDFTVYSDCNLTSSFTQSYVPDLDKCHAFLQLEMLEAQKCYQGPADAKCSPIPDFKVGDREHSSDELCLLRQWYHPQVHIPNLGKFTPSPLSWPQGLSPNGRALSYPCPNLQSSLPSFPIQPQSKPSLTIRLCFRLILFSIPDLCFTVLNLN